MECPYCKTVNREGVRYCGNCGKLIDAAPAPDGGSNASHPLVPGSRLQGGRYIIRKVLGQGGMGAALLATDIRLDGKPVVIKELISDQITPIRLQDDVRNFKREVATLAHIDHPLVPNVTDHFQEGTRYYMVQEYVEGENLEERLDRTNQPMKEREALIYASEILDVLDYLAQQTPPIVHRDIKPANIVIGAKERRAHLVDFGIARAEVVRNAQRRQTAALGTPGYAPPEQYQGNADPRSDLYALAATLHHLLTNRDPRNHPPFIYPPVRTLNPQLSQEIERVLARALTNDINKRYQSAAAMKQDIDNILRRRFGITDTFNSYILGSSGQIGTVNTLNGADAAVASSMTNQSTVASSAQPATPYLVPPPPSRQSPYMPPQPVAPSYPYQPGGYRKPAPQKQRAGKAGFYGLIAALVALAIVAGGMFLIVNNPAHIGQKPAGTSAGGAHKNAGGTPTGIGVTNIHGENIGVSDGSFAFDTNRSDGNLKLQAASSFRQGNVSSAVALWDQANAEDSSDAEVLIYLEDQRIASFPHITLVVGTMLSGDSGSVGVGRDDLQGAYVAQKEFNDGSKLSGGLKVRLLVASSGSQAQYAKQVAQQIVQLAQADPTFVGVMGWPYSSRTIEAVQVLSAAHIPMVSQTASSDLLSGISPYFFRVAPSNKAEAISGAKYVEQVLHARNVAVFEDIADPYSQGLAQDFMQQFQADGNTIVATEKYTEGKPATLPGLLQDALRHNPDCIYFSGYATDVSTLLINLPPGNLPVMGGDALYELNGYPSSASVGFHRLHFTAFAYPDEWGVLGLAAREPSFFANYPAAFDPNRLHKGTPYGFTRADNDAILSYDATIALLKGCNIALGANPGKKNITPQDLQQGLQWINGANAIQGVSGEIAFGTNGDPVNKAIVILSVDPQGHIKMEPNIEGRFLV
jgi:serine/threonine protein kinase/ABC-type branched-subunit amino acid transport system substrate-binding protein